MHGFIKRSEMKLTANMEILSRWSPPEKILHPIKGQPPRNSNTVFGSLLPFFKNLPKKEFAPRPTKRGEEGMPAL